MEDSELLPGVRALEHTADLALEIAAPSLPELFHRAAAGMFALIAGDGNGDADAAAEATPHHVPIGEEDDVVRELDLAAPDLAALLVAWLRELLYLYEVHRLLYRHAEFAELAEAGILRVRVHGATAAPNAVREIKGVTYHQLAVTRRDGSWRARVVFDV